MRPPAGREAPPAPRPARRSGTLTDFSSWSLRRRLAVLVAIVAVVTLGVSLFTAVTAWNAKQTLSSEQQTLLPASRNAGSLLSALVDQETAERGFLITDNPSFLAPYQAGQVDEARLAGSLRAELAGHPDLTGELRSVETLHSIWLAQAAHPEIAAERSDPSHAAALVADGTGERDFDAIRTAVAALEQGIDQAAEQQSASVDTTLNRMFVLSIFRGLVVVALLFLAWLLIRRWVNEPLEQLSSEVESVAAGDLDRTIEVQGPPEVSSLGRAIEAMRRRLRDEADELRQLRETLAEHSPLHVLLGSELEPSTRSAFFSVGGRLLSTEGVLAGDWYDAWEMEGPRLEVALVDISGHGPAAGLFALRMKHLLSPPLRAGMSPGAALSWVAAEIGETDEQFATAIVADLDVTKGLCRYANAGHPDGLLVRADGVERLAPTGPLMCALPGAWSTAQATISPGDLLVLITDGVIEARLPDGSELGLERIVEVVERHGPGADPDLVAESVISAVREACVLPLRDDATVVAVRAGPA